MNPVLKKKISILIHLAGIDGDFAKVEKSFIKDICDRNEVSNHEFEELLLDPEPIGSLGALSYAKVVEYMSDSLSLMIVDGKIRQSEVILCEDIGLRLGFQKNSIDQVIEILKDNIDRPISKIFAIVEAMSHPSKG
jgi:uncharacterized tellurite resistance protein B-like protein